MNKIYRSDTFEKTNEICEECSDLIKYYSDYYGIEYKFFKTQIESCLHQYINNDFFNRKFHYFKKYKEYLANECDCSISKIQGQIIRLKHQYLIVSDNAHSYTYFHFYDIIAEIIETYYKRKVEKLKNNYEKQNEILKNNLRHKDKELKRIKSRNWKYCRHNYWR